MALSDLIASANSVFLSTELFGESIKHFHPARPKATVNAIVDRDDMLKPPEGSGASRVIEQLDGERGSQLRTWAMVELAASVEVAFMGANLDPSRFEFADGSEWHAVAPEGSDAAMQTVWCTRLDRRATRKAGA